MMPPLRSDTTFLVLLVVILLATLAVTSRDVPGPPALAALAPRPTPTPTATATPGWWNGVLMATPTLPSLPGLPNLQFGRSGTGDRGNGPIAFKSIACPGDHARIRSITRNGIWWLIDGTASTEDFWYWKMELSPDGQNWTVLYRSESPVSRGRLMEFNTSTVSPGGYRLRLVVVKRDGNYPEPCEIEVTV